MLPHKDYDTCINSSRVSITGYVSNQPPCGELNGQDMFRTLVLLDMHLILAIMAIIDEMDN